MLKIPSGPGAVFLIVKTLGVSSAGVMRNVRS